MVVTIDEDAYHHRCRTLSDLLLDVGIHVCSTRVGVNMTYVVLGVIFDTSMSVWSDVHIHVNYAICWRLHRRLKPQMAAVLGPWTPAEATVLRV